MNLDGKKFHLQSDEHKNKKKMWHCDFCGIDMSLRAKSNHLKKISHVEKSSINIPAPQLSPDPDTETKSKFSDGIPNKVLTEAVAESAGLKDKIKCETCGIIYKKSNEYNHKLTNGHLRSS